jgi:hypothetical protein
MRVSVMMAEKKTALSKVILPAALQPPKKHHCCS